MIGKVSQMSLLAAIGVVAIGSLSACVSPNSYAGVSLLRGDGDPDIQSLARRAKGGSKQAQLQLGIRYEEGDGVPVNLNRARSLYQEAAEDSPIHYTVYMPTENGVRPEIIHAGTRKGLTEAMVRLECLEQNVQVGERALRPSESTRTANECNK